MNTKNNKRKRESVEKIERVFLEQLKEKELSQIKVSDICTAAGINRSTFYASYEDLYDLAGKLRVRLEQTTNELFEKQVPGDSIEKYFLKLFYHIRENQVLYSFYFKLGYDRTDNLKLYDIAALEGGEQQELDYRMLFFRGGLNALIKKWLKEGCADAPEQMRDILLREYRGRFEEKLCDSAAEKQGKPQKN
ncbi:MAG: TetR/AcrR family transcriptional regulator C-terminal domain-containing protein [Clostridia bacterium]|nr:TetR/AcrR family transcriptional regulator C-terminal domain-containing protein [Clostridia bacterium]